MKVLCKNKGPTPSSATAVKGTKKGKGRPSSNKSTPAATPAASAADGGDEEAENDDDEVQQPAQDEDDVDDGAAEDNAGKQLAATCKHIKATSCLVHVCSSLQDCSTPAACLHCCQPPE